MKGEEICFHLLEQLSLVSDSQHGLTRSSEIIHKTTAKKPLMVAKLKMKGGKIMITFCYVMLGVMTTSMIGGGILSTIFG